MSRPAEHGSAFWAGYPPEQIAEMSGAVLTRPAPSSKADTPVIRHLSMDSRSPDLGADTLFVALKGPSRDGQRYIPDAWSKGVRCFLAAQPIPLPGPACWLIHPDPLRALQALAGAHRRRFSYPVLALTGSNGKTIVKEWLTALLQPDWFVVRNPRSYNSQIGVPLSIWAMREEHEIGIFEAGISQPGEMVHLAEMLHPDIGLFTHLGDPHDEGFNNREQKLQEKLRLFDSCSRLLFSEDQPEVAGAIRQRYPDRQHLTWSLNGIGPDSALQATRSADGLWIRYQGQELRFPLPFDDPISTQNLIHAINAALALGVAPDQLLRRIPQLTLPDLRLQVQQGRQGCILVNDAYSSDIGSLQLALAFAARQARPGMGRTAVLSDLEQSGLQPLQRYAAVAEALRVNGFERLIAVGPEISVSEAFSDVMLNAFPDTDALLRELPLLDLQDQVILIKGARRFALEQVAAALAEKVHGTRLEIDLDALAHNLSTYRDHLPRGTRLLVLVKALGYGSGDAEIAGVLAYNRADYLGVAYADEGIRLRQAGIRLPILVLNADEESLPLMLRYQLEPELYRPDQVERVRTRYPELSVHLKLDTGMHRLGLTEPEIQELLAHPDRLRGLRLRSVFSHMAAAEDPQHDEFSHRQIERFRLWAPALAAAWTSVNPGEQEPWLHLFNSAAMLRFPHERNDMVRLGIGLYGHDPGGVLQSRLRAVSCLLTTVVQIRTVAAGESVGYGRGVVLEKDTRVATLSIGYADGFRRSLGLGVGCFSAYGKRMPVLGKVCMDMTMADCSGVPELREGDSVEVFGRDISLEEMAERMGTIPYEVLTGVSSRVRRVYLKG